jgi:hypothetical protein
MGWTTAALYDSLGDRILLYNGFDVWSLAAASGPAWSRMDATGPGGLAGASAILDPRRNRLIVYGGYIPQPHLSGYTVSDVWSLSLNGSPTWALLGSGPEPLGSAGHAAFYDPPRDRMVIMGGYWQNANSFQHAYGSSVWATTLDGALAWTSLTSPTGPKPSFPPQAQVVYDSRRDRMLVFADSTVWSRRVEDAAPWMRLDATGPAPVVSAPVVFDPTGDQVLALFSALPGAAQNQAWVLAFGPPLTSQLRAAATFEAAEIAWRSFSSIGREAIVQRREEATAWAQIASLTIDQTGTVALSDRDVVPGERYAYRLGILEGETTWYSDSTWLEIPPRPLLSLQGARPNPATGTFDVVFSLPGPGPAKLEAFDVRGRRILACDVGGLGPGTHAIALDLGRTLAAGVYLIRLQRAGQSCTTRAVILR